MTECLEEKKKRGRKPKVLLPDELQSYAMKYHCFTRDLEQDIVYCPKGNVLRHKSRHRDGEKYCAKATCGKCKWKCTKAKFKEVVFTDGQVILGKNRKKRKKVVKEKVDNL